MPVLVADEYPEVDGLPLRTPAWTTTSMAGLYDSSPVAGMPLVVAHHHGEVPPVRQMLGKVCQLPMVIFGDEDYNGVPYDNVRTGMRRNLDKLKQHLRPRISGDGTVQLIHRHPDGDRDARCQVVSPLSTGAVGPTGMRAVVDLWLPDGVMRSTTPTTASGSGSTAFNMNVPNPGSADQFDTQITLSGGASGGVVISSAVFGGVSLSYPHDLGLGDVVINTGRFTAVRGGSDVHGLVTAEGHPRWLPIPAGGATWTVTPTGGTAFVDVSHRAAWQ